MDLKRIEELITGINEAVHGAIEEEPNAEHHIAIEFDHDEALELLAAAKRWVTLSSWPQSRERQETYLEQDKRIAALEAENHKLYDELNMVSTDCCQLKAKNARLRGLVLEEVDEKMKWNAVGLVVGKTKDWLNRAKAELEGK